MARACFWISGLSGLFRPGGDLFQDWTDGEVADWLFCAGIQLNDANDSWTCKAEDAMGWAVLGCW